MCHRLINEVCIFLKICLIWSTFTLTHVRSAFILIDVCLGLLDNHLFENPSDDDLFQGRDVLTKVLVVTDEFDGRLHPVIQLQGVELCLQVLEQILYLRVNILDDVKLHLQREDKFY